MSEHDVMRDAVGLVLSIGRQDWAGYRALADSYGMGFDQRQLVSTLAGLLAAPEPELDLEDYALYLARKP